MTDTTQVGVIGVGYMGWNHARMYDEIPTVELVGISDKNRRRAAEAAEEFGTASLTMPELLATADAVSIAVPTEYHSGVVSDCLDAGVHVLVEKPFVDDLDTGRALIERSEDAGLTLQVGHIERFNPAVRTLTDIAAQLDVVAISTRRVGPGVDRELTDSVALDLMIHDIDIVLSMLEPPLEELTSVTTADGQYATAGMRFANGVVVDMTASRVTQRDTRTIEVATESGCIVADCIDQTVEVHRESPTVPHETNGHRPYRCDGVVERPRVEQSDALRTEIESFVSSVENGTQPEVTGWDGLQAVEIAQRIEEATTTGVIAETPSR